MQYIVQLMTKIKICILSYFQTTDITMLTSFLLLVYFEVSSSEEKHKLILIFVKPKGLLVYIKLS